MPIIRQAELRDAAPLAALAERTFRDTFEAANTPEDMALHCREHYREALQGQEILDPGLTTLVCEHDGELVAFAQLRRDPPPPCVPSARPLEIQRLYVASAWHGKGLAQELMRHCLTQAESEGADQVWLGVWEHNPRAIAFYRKFGFQEVGNHIFPLGTDPQCDLILVRPAVV